jgi:hypothetical protein
VVVAGALANKPWNGGEAWVRLSYVFGLRRLDFRVYFVEQIAAAQCTDEAVSFFDVVTGTFGLAGASALVRDDGVVLRGPGEEALLDIADDADLLLNISGNLTIEPVFDGFRRRAYVDLDPGYTQLWFADGHPVNRLAEHHVHFTVGANVGTPRCGISVGQIAWRPTSRPVLLNDWPAVAAPAVEKFTTVATWRGGYGRLERDSVVYGQKAHEFRKLVDLPARVAVPFEIALSIDAGDDADRQSLEEHGWRLVNPRSVAATPADYRRYVQESSAEFSPAQGIYVETNCGWVADRTACYLASGRPAVVQETGLGAEFPVGEGLLTFRTFGDAVQAIDKVRSDWTAHAVAARALAAEHFDSDRVLRALLEDAL